MAREGAYGSSLSAAGRPYAVRRSEADHMTMALLRAVVVPRRPVAALEPVIVGERYARLTSGAARYLARLAGRTVWNVNSTAVGRGVAEMLQALVGYVRDLEVPVRWMVIGGDPTSSRSRNACTTSDQFRPT
jgi:hypothetical protein